MPRWPTRASGTRRRKPVDHAEPGAQDRDDHDLVGRAATPGAALQRRLRPRSPRPQVAHRLVGEHHRRLAQRCAEPPVRRRPDRAACETSRRSSEWSTTVTPSTRAQATSLVGPRWRRRAATSSSRPSTPIPQRSLARRAARSAPRTAGVLRQRDTYFRARAGRLKLREEEPGGATLIAVRPPGRRARRARAATASSPSPSRARCAPRSTRALGTLVVVDKERHLLLWESVRIHLDDGRRASARSSSSRRSPRGLRPAAEREQVARLREALGLDDASCADSYSDRAASAPTRLLAARARGAMARAYAPYSRFHGRRRAARRGRLARTPAPTSRTPPTRRASAPRRPRSARWSPPAADAVRRGRRDRDRRPSRACRAAAAASGCASSCRPRRRRAPVPRRRRARAPSTLGELLPLSFGPEACRRDAIAAAARGAIAERAPGFAPRLGIVLGSGLGGAGRRARGRRRDPVRRAARLPAPGVAGHAGRAGRSARSPACRSPCLQGRAHVYEGGDPGAHARARCATAPSALGAEALLLTNAAGSLRADVGPGS